MKDRCVEDSDPYDSTSASEEEYVPESAAEEEDSDASLPLKQTPRKSLDWLPSECSPILCDSSTTNVDINSTDCQIAEEQPSSSQGPNAMWLLMHSTRMMARGSTTRGNIVCIAASPTPKFQGTLKVHTVTKWMWQKPLVFRRDLRKEKFN